MQRCGLPGGRKEIIVKASQLLTTATERTIPTRSSPTRILTGDAKLFIELKIDATRLFNMVETSFLSKTTRRKVVAVRGSANVWRKETKPNFRMTVDVAALTIKDAAITGAPKAFSNTKIFMKWLRFFGEHVTNFKKPVVLIMDNSTTHIGPEAVETCVEYGIMLVTLPANATHLLQQLDVAIFKPYKDTIKDLMFERLCAINDSVIRKTNAVQMACTAYRRSLLDKPTSAVNGFRECGIWSLLLVKLCERLALYQGGGVKCTLGTAEWLTHREAIIDAVRTEVLLFPPVATTSKKRKRTTVDVAGRLVTKEQLLAGVYD
ncbi:hypothetical protein PHMEG_00010028 [Phytophthora megakarya]|uniref:DDE-1 domain-containing protein n=1 Tax=Phytophthora megakarya TaxID=4795 RepID=A0A225WGR5_9STRA|nr:hypothetical protein PHMEG_00010028 [Phytophthora megakarya]